MRYRVTFLVGFAAGFVAGARAGRERYEQMMKLGRTAAEHPTVRKATQAAGQKATDLGKAARDQATARVPRVTETAKSSASKVRGQLDRMPGRRSADTEPAGVDGTRPVD